MLLEEHLHDHDLVLGRRAENGVFRLAEGEGVVEAQRHRIDDLESQRGIVERLQRVADRRALLGFVHQHEALAVLEPGQAGWKSDDLVRIDLHAAEQIGLYIHGFLPVMAHCAEHATRVVADCIFVADCA